MKFAIPRILWNRLTTQATAISAWWILPNVALARARLPSCIQTFHLPRYHTAPELPVPNPPKRGSAIFRREQQVRQRGRYCRSRLQFHRCGWGEKPYFPNQKDLNDLIRDLGLTKSNAELLTSRLKEWKLLDESVQVTDQRKRHQRFSNFFSREGGLCFCNDVPGLFEAIGITCNPIEWRLFIDSSSRSLRAVPSLTTGTSTRLSLWLTLCTWRRTTPVSRCCWVPWSITTMAGRSLDTSKWCHSWWASKAVSQSFLASFASGTAETLRRTIVEGTGQSEPSSL